MNIIILYDNLFYSFYKISNVCFCVCLRGDDVCMHARVGAYPCACTCIVCKPSLGFEYTTLIRLC